MLADTCTWLPPQASFPRVLRRTEPPAAAAQEQGACSARRLCPVIASVEPEARLKAIALKGEKADIRAIMQSPDDDPGLRRALGDVLVTTGDIIGMHGHRSQLRHLR